MNYKQRGRYKRQVMSKKFLIKEQSSISKFNFKNTQIDMIILYTWGKKKIYFTTIKILNLILNN